MPIIHFEEIKRSTCNIKSSILDLGCKVYTDYSKIVGFMGQLIIMKTEGSTNRMFSPKAPKLSVKAQNRKYSVNNNLMDCWTEFSKIRKLRDRKLLWNFN